MITIPFPVKVSPQYVGRLNARIREHAELTKEDIPTVAVILHNADGTQTVEFVEPDRAEKIQAISDQYKDALQSLK